MSRVREWWWLLLPFAVSLVAFGPGLVGGFVLDDELAIVRNPVVQGEVSLFEAFERNFWGKPLDVTPPAYRPLVTLSFRLDRAVFGDWAPGYHLSSLLYYLALIGAARLVARRYLDRPATALALSVFAVMPVHVENVSSLVGRADTLAVLFGLLGLWSALRYGDEPPCSRTARWWLGASGSSFVAALLCKESAIAWPLVVLAITATTCPELGRRSFRPWWPGLTWLALAAIYVAWRGSAIPATWSTAYIDDDVLRDASVWARGGFALEVLGHSARLLVAPVDLCTGRKFATTALPDSVTAYQVVAALLVLAVVLHTIAALRRRQPPWFACAMLSWSVFSHLAFSVPEAMADRFLLGPTLFVCVGTAALFHHPLRRPVGRGVAVLFIACECAASAFYATRWQDSETLIAHAVVVCPDSAHNRFRYARQLAARGEVDEAIWNFAVAAQIRQAFPHAYPHALDEIEYRLTARERVLRMHELLQVENMDEGAWRTAFMHLMLQQRLPALAQRIADTSPIRIGAPPERDR